MNSGVRDGYRYFFVLCGGCAPGTPPVCERMRRFSQNPQNPQKKIINLINQINLRETYAVCDEGVLPYAPTGQG